MKTTLNNIYKRMENYFQNNTKIDVLISFETTSLEMDTEIVNLSYIFIKDMHVDSIFNIYFNYENEKAENLGLIYNRLENNVKINWIRRFQEQNFNIKNDLDFLLIEPNNMKIITKFFLLKNLTFYFPFDFHYNLFMRRFASVNEVIKNKSKRLIKDRISLVSFFENILEKRGINKQDLKLYSPDDYFLNLEPLKNKLLYIYAIYLNYQNLDNIDIINIINGNFEILKRDFFISNYKKTSRIITII